MGFTYLSKKKLEEIPILEKNLNFCPFFGQKRVKIGEKWQFYPQNGQKGAKCPPLLHITVYGTNVIFSLQYERDSFMVQVEC